MDRDELAELVERWITLWDAPPDWELFEALHADDFVDHSSAGRPDTKAGFAEGLRDLVAAFPDLSTSTQQLVVDDATRHVAVRWSSVGTNTGRYLGVGPTHRRTTITGIEIVRVAGRRITERWGEWDITDHRKQP